MKIIIVRHGKDDDRYRGGWCDLDLIPEGRKQAKLLAEYLKKNYDRYPITEAISSDLPRAMTTAQYVADELTLQIQSEPQLREMNNGDLAGMLNEVALKRYPGLFFDSLQMDEAYPNGESPNDFYFRIKNWFEKFYHSVCERGRCPIIITHGGVINVLYHLVECVEWTNKSRICKASNCGIHVLNLDTMQFVEKNNIEFLR